jgi:hypothetical protein
MSTMPRNGWPDPATKRTERTAYPHFAAALPQPGTIRHPAAVKGHTGEPSPKIEDAHGG